MVINYSSKKNYYVKENKYNHEEFLKTQAELRKRWGTSEETIKKREAFFNTPMIAPYYPINPPQEIENSSETKEPVDSPGESAEDLKNENAPAKTTQVVTHEERVAKILKEIEEAGWSYEKAYNALCIY